jgi:non-ribosomal peptide synthetase component F/aryl carrier-like protein
MNSPRTREPGQVGLNLVDRIYVAPDAALAVVDGDVGYTYAALRSRISAIQSAIEPYVVPGAVLFLCIDRGVNFVSALCAGLTSGIVTGLGNAAAPVSQLARAIDAMRPCCILVEAAQLASAGDQWYAWAAHSNSTLMSIDIDGIVLVHREGAAGEAMPAYENCHRTAYLIATSGSTGEPKIVAGTLAGLEHFLDWKIAEFVIDHHVRSLQLAPTSFDVCLREVLVPLCVGGVVLIPTTQEKQSPARLLAWMAAHKPTLVNTVPSVLKLLLDTLGGAGGHASDAFASVDWLFVAGEPWTFAAAKRALGLRLKRGLVSLYGPTECTLAQFYFRVLPDTCGHDSSLVPLGRPIGDTVVTVISDADDLASNQGEIVIHSAFISNGYLTPPDTASSSFHASPHFAGQLGGGRCFLTKDIGRLDEQGRLLYLGRKDEMLKIGGIKVYPREVEAVALLDSRIQAAVVYVAASPNANDELTCVCSTNGDIDIQALRDKFTQLLPSMACPSQIVVTDELPLLSNGKVNRSALRDIGAAAIAERRDKVARDAPTEIGPILQICREVLGRPGLDPDEDLLRLGVSSLSLMRILGAVFTSTGELVDIADLMRVKTARGLADLTEDKMLSEAAFAPPDLSQRHLRPAERMMLELAAYPPAQRAYNEAVCFRIRGPLDVDKVQLVARQLVDRFPSFRTVYVGDDSGEYLRRELPAPDGALLTCTDYMGQLDSLALVHAQLREDCAALRDLSTAPPFTARLFKLASDDYVLTLAFFHILADLWSIDILAQEAASAYAALCSGSAVACLPTLTSTPVPLPVERGAEYGGKAAAHAYWSAALRDHPVIDLGTSQRPPFRLFEGRTLAWVIDSDGWAAIQLQASNLGLTPFTFLLSAYFVALQRCTGNSDLIVGVPMSTRGAGHVHDIDLQMSILPVRLAVQPDCSIAEVAACTAEQLAQVLAHRHLPFQEIVALSERGYGLDRSPLFDIAFSYVDAEALNVRDLMLTVSGQRFQVSAFDFDRGTTKYDLMLFAAPCSDGTLSVRAEYDRALLSEQQIESFYSVFRDVLETGVGQP